MTVNFIETIPGERVSTLLFAIWCATASRMRKEQDTMTTWDTDIETLMATTHTELLRQFCAGGSNTMGTPLRHIYNSSSF